VQGIQQQGYSLALDDFSDSSDLAPLTRMANVIKVDMPLSSRQEQQRLLQTHKPWGALMPSKSVTQTSLLRQPSDRAELGSAPEPKYGVESIEIRSLARRFPFLISRCERELFSEGR
jgi:hypothetical protein